MTPQQQINALEAERQALYNLGNGLEVDGDARRARLETIAGKLEKTWEAERAVRASRYVGKDDAAWEQPR